MKLKRCSYHVSTKLFMIFCISSFIFHFMEIFVFQFQIDGDLDFFKLLFYITNISVGIKMMVYLLLLGDCLVSRVNNSFLLIKIAKTFEILTASLSLITAITFPEAFFLGITYEIRTTIFSLLLLEHRKMELKQILGKNK